MDASRRGQVITFYSFKGGVGRSMALANVAAIEAQRGRSVLALDFDFEAPGLHRYFLTREGAKDERTGSRKGMLDFFTTLRDRLPAIWPAGSRFHEEEERRRLAGLLVNELFDSGDYLHRVEIGNPNARDAPPARIDFVAAARFDESYPDRVRDFDWQGFYDDYAGIFHVLAGELAKRYAYVLIDSRTGVTDLGSICTMLLPDKLVLVFTPNEQSLSGALDAGWQAVKGREQVMELMQAGEPPASVRALPIFPLASRVEEGETSLQRTWTERARRGFELLFREAYKREAVDLETYFNAIMIPHRSFYAYGERIAAEDEASAKTGSLAQAYSRFAAWLDSTDAETAQRAESSTIVPASAARRFAVTTQMSEASSKAALLVQVRPAAPPSLNVAVAPASPAEISPATIVQMATQCQIFSARGHEMFPRMPMRSAPERFPEGLLWSMDEAGYVLRFAIGFDGSFAYSEQLRPHPRWGPGVGLFTCLDRIVGATLYARKLAVRTAMHQSSLCFSLVGVKNARLTFDFEDAMERGIHARSFVSNADVLRVGGAFDPAIDDADVELFGAGVGAALAYYFGWDWQDAVATRELHDILEAAANRDPQR